MVGYYMDKRFTVNDRRIFTPQNLKGQAGSSWATHEVYGGKARSQYTGPKLKSYTFDILLRAQDGVNPRTTLRYFQNRAEAGDADYFMIGNTPLSQHPFKLTDVSDEWGAVFRNGKLIECKISLTIEEYV